jgi:type IV pilus assembly protein PilA
MQSTVRLTLITVLATLALSQSGYGAQADGRDGGALASQLASGSASRRSEVGPAQDSSPIAAYKDYLIRSQVTEGAVLAEAPEMALEVFYSDNKRWPQNNAQAGLSPPMSIAGRYVSSVNVGVQPGTIVVTYGRQAAAAPIRGKALALSASTQSGTVAWNCYTSMTTIPAKYLPSTCKK